ncbi:MAG: integration host factor subunit alpha [Syntrophales bacterium]|jgi:integration host factor subunit alpha|nr:integration host factor subunit alpha [Syntrophales bacterium]MCK9528510.1 integration host factor subunit alpha [Syntrophales bacterium]MDX9922864.1 integration host factor subunit alpha [Syntrophales bacterium]
MALTKKDMIDQLSENLEMTKPECARIVEGFFDIIKSELEQGNPVKISGFGKWTVNAKKARKGRNPQTGEKITIEPRKVITFKASEKLKTSINDE